MQTRTKHAQNWRQIDGNSKCHKIVGKSADFTVKLRLSANLSSQDRNFGHLMATYKVERLFDLDFRKTAERIYGRESCYYIFVPVPIMGYSVVHPR